MKKLLTIIGVITALSSCTKEASFEKTCGTVTDKDLLRHLLYIDGKAIEVGLVQVNTYKIGDTYCQ